MWAIAPTSSNAEFSTRSVSASSVIIYFIVILCAEENVVGNHGATIGELDEDTLFYFESRGISAAEAENIMARAAIERLARTIEDEAAQAAILSELEEVL